MPAIQNCDFPSTVAALQTLRSADVEPSSSAVGQSISRVRCGSDLRPRQDACRPHAVTVLGRDLVIWRDQQGEWRAFDDACPHRLAPLSGAVRSRHVPHCVICGTTLRGAYVPFHVKNHHPLQLDCRCDNRERARSSPVMRADWTTFEGQSCAAGQRGVLSSVICQQPVGLWVLGFALLNTPSLTKVQVWA